MSLINEVSIKFVGKIIISSMCCKFFNFSIYTAKLNIRLIILVSWFCIFGPLDIFSVIWLSIYLVLWIWSSDPTRSKTPCKNIRTKSITCFTTNPRGGLFWGTMLLKRQRFRKRYNRRWWYTVSANLYVLQLLLWLL